MRAANAARGNTVACGYLSCSFTWSIKRGSNPKRSACSRQHGPPLFADAPGFSARPYHGPTRVQGAVLPAGEEHEVERHRLLHVVDLYEIEHPHSNLHLCAALGYLGPGCRKRLVSRQQQSDIWVT